MNPCPILDNFGSPHNHVEQHVNGNVIASDGLTAVGHQVQADLASLSAVKFRGAASFSSPSLSTTHRQKITIRVAGWLCFAETTVND
jgi:hypothetical protein